MEPISVAIEQLLRRLQSGPQASESERVWGRMKNFFSAVEQEHVRLDSVRNGTAVLTVDSSSWLYYFTMKKQRDIDGAKIPGVRNVRFSLGTSQKNQSG